MLRTNKVFDALQCSCSRQYCNSILLFYSCTLVIIYLSVHFTAFFQFFRSMWIVVWIGYSNCHDCHGFLSIVDINCPYLNHRQIGLWSVCGFRTTPGPLYESCQSLQFSTRNGLYIRRTWTSCFRTVWKSWKGTSTEAIGNFNTQLLHLFMLFGTKDGSRSPKDQTQYYNITGWPSTSQTSDFHWLYSLYL
jgi:hypothetical protein